ncbi:glucose-6-phosphate exchanger SLC37A4 isoform X1 [Lingula anatina]|uniref:Glucose-6-phosphate exchanger SLC37A4 isoform X1 n=2 Tax=Lingula anatina TaxID=7574 RepID=A0A1S3K927_LINAN|nr:glucose-6-phosphate exchanger SLC37A4 isoform X1 [Lingula anatina]|eukprot:XP_013419002.1 glucose-6-phosphate exchanger SLC37A4 isoform X1 [Lingula anatina]
MVLSRVYAVDTVTFKMAIERSLLGYQITNFVSMYIGYAFYMMNRKAFSFALPVMIKQEGLSKSDLGMVLSSNYVAYTISKFLAGVLSDRIPPNILFSVGLFFSGVAVTIFSETSQVWLFVGIWFINGLSQGAGWPSCVKVLKHWFSPATFGTWWGVLSTSMNAANSLGPFIAMFIMLHYDWRFYMKLQGVTTCIFAMIVFFAIKNSPKSVGIDYDIQGAASQKKDDDKKSKGDSLENSTATWRDLIASPFLWVISLLILLILGTTTAVIDWGQLYLIQDREQSNYVGSTFMSLYGIGGTIGSIIPSYIADRLVAKQSPGSTFNPRLTVVLALSALTVNFLHLFTYCVTSESSQLWISVLAFGLGFGLYGSVALLGVVAVECAPPHLSGTSHALYGIGSNVGSVLAGLPLSYVAKYYNWSGVFVVLEAVGILTVAILVACRWMSHVIAVDKKKKTD